MRIEMWSDIVCPICGLTERRLDAAVKQFEHGDDVEIVHRSFQVHPGLSREGVTQRDLSYQHGMTDRDIERVLGPLERAHEAEGFGPYHAIERTLGPTDYAHELLAFATDKGKHDEAWSAMFQAHFGEGRTFWTLDDVAAFAGEIGLDEAEAREALTSRRYKRQVEEEQRAAQDAGATGTPFILIDGKYAITGGRSTDVLSSALRQVWEETHQAPSPVQLVGGAGDTCTDDACGLPSA
jgi:predicted DsbA family dithiol-disulfide isomerase